MGRDGTSNPPHSAVQNMWSWSRVDSRFPHRWLYVVNVNERMSNVVDPNSILKPKCKCCVEYYYILLYISLIVDPHIICYITQILLLLISPK